MNEIIYNIIISNYLLLIRLSYEVNKMKKILSLLLAVTMIVSLFAGTGIVSYAADDILSLLTYETENGEVTITGCEYGALSGSVTIPDKINGYPVTTIGSWSFAYQELITEVIMPSTIETICNGAFSFTDLRTVFIPESVTTIGAGIFNGCYKLKNIYYGGDEAAWAKIDIETYNDHIAFAKIHYNSDGQNMTPDTSRPDYPEQEQKKFTLAEEEFKSINLPFDFSNVVAYDTSGETAVFLVIDTVEMVEVDEWSDSAMVTYRIYSTDDFVNFDHYEFVLGPGTIEHEQSWILDCYDWFTDRFNCDIYWLGEPGSYYFSIYLLGGPNDIITIGYLFEDGKITQMDEEIAATNLAFFEDRCIMVDFVTPAYVTAVEKVPAENPEYFNYKVTIAPRYYYTTDFVTWTEAYGPEDYFITDWEMEVGSFYSYFYATTGNGILSFRYRPEEEPCEVRGFEWHNVFTTTDGVNYVELERAAESYYPVWYIANSDSTFFELSSVCYVESDFTAFMQITLYDSNGRIIRTDKDDSLIDYYAYIHTDSINNFIFSETDANGEFMYSVIYEYDKNMNLSNYISEFAITDLIFGARQFTTDAIFFIYTADTLIAYVNGCATANMASLPYMFYSFSAWNGNMIFFGETSYMVSEEAIMTAIGGAQDVFDPSDIPDYPITDENRLIVDTETEITVDDDRRYVTVPRNSACDELADSIKNDNFAIIDKDGNELSISATLGTGCLILVKDAEGNIISKYEIAVKNDIDGNGKITAADARLALRASAKIDTIDGVYAFAADATGDDKITAMDARTILRKAAGLE